MNQNLNIIIVGYNEEENLPKLFQSLNYLKDKINIRLIYIDQTSIDNSVSIAKTYGCEVYIHENKGYADPDKKWAVENLVSENEWILICDADYFFSIDLNNEIIEKIKENLVSAYWIKRGDVFLGINKIYTNQLIFFKKGSVIITDEIHKYFQLNTENVGCLKNSIIAEDLKNSGKEFFREFSKYNSYTEKEISKYENMPLWKVKVNILLQPIIWVVGIFILRKQFLYGFSGIIRSFMIGIYQFILYSKVYEYKINLEKYKK